MREGIPQKSRIGLMLRISLVLSVGVVIGGGVYVAVWSIITPRLAMLDSHEEVIQKITRSIEGLLDKGRLSTDYERDEGIRAIIIEESAKASPSARGHHHGLEDQLNHAEGMM
ncbi:hypothetical protein FOZ62_015077, partial [Perkinsus olseni]